MKASASVVFTFGLIMTVAQAPRPKRTDYTGWQIIVTGTETTTAQYASDLGYRTIDECTVVKRGNSKYVIKKKEPREGSSEYKIVQVSARTEIEVGGKGEFQFYAASPPKTEHWTYKLGPSPYPKDVESFHPVGSGAPQTSPDEPVFLPRMVQVSSYIPASEWSSTKTDQDSPAKDMIFKAWEQSGDSLDYVFPHRLDDKHLAYSGHRTFSFNNHDVMPVEDIKGTVVIDVTYDVELIPAGQTEEPPEVTVDVKEYEKWLPKGNVNNPADPGEDPMEITATVHKRGDRNTPRKAYLSIALPYVSKNKGICGNWPRSADEQEGLRFREEDFSGDDELAYKDRTHLQTRKLVESVTFQVYSYDYGAWGTLRVTARDEGGQNLKVRVVGKETQDLDIPEDEDSNRIADAWKKEEVFRKSKDYDGDKVEGQDEEGDGITAYDEYRGIVMSVDGKRIHQRLSPTEKEMFILDESQTFPLSKWKMVSGIGAYRLDNSEVDPAGNPGKSPLVNFNSESKDAHGVYALKIQVRSDDPKDNLSPAFAHCPPPCCIKNAVAVSVFPARFVQRIEEDYAWLNTAILNPDSEEGKALRNEGPANGIAYADADAAWSRLFNAGLRKSIAAKLQKAVFLHEVGHVLDLVDHEGAAPAGQEEPARACLMFLQGQWGRRRTLVYTALGRGDPEFAYPYREFCRNVSAAGYRCYRSLSLKNK